MPESVIDRSCRVDTIFVPMIYIILSPCLLPSIRVIFCTRSFLRHCAVGIQPGISLPAPVLSTLISLSAVATF
jgi:hypothetical protein